jgi:hypothetical protein
MSEQPAPYRPNPVLKPVERVIEAILFNSRWLMAPFYIGLVISLFVPAPRRPISSSACCR